MHVVDMEVCINRASTEAPLTQPFQRKHGIGRHDPRKATIRNLDM
jgi:hypothetical protein